MLGKMYLKPQGKDVLNILDFIEAISRAINRPHVLVTYFNAELKTPDHHTCNNTNLLISVDLVHNRVCVCVY